MEKMKSGSSILLFLILVWITGVLSCSEENEIPHDNNGDNETIQLVFKGGTEEYACYRVCTMVYTNQGTLLAFCEGRLNNCDDEGDIDLVLKRSTNGGKTWGSLQVLENDGPNPCKNPCPVVLPSGRILLV